jgi:photosystem II stability/assembly factor-like uncharacterized protein
MKNLFLIFFVWGLLLYSHTEADTPWQKLEGPYGGIINPVAIDQANQLFAIFDNNFATSTDDGKSWTTILKNGYTFKIGQDSKLYAESLGRKIYVSQDKGNSWIGLPLTINGLRLDRMAIAADGTLYFAAGERLYMSSDQGQEWSVVSENFNGSAVRVLVSQNFVFVYGNNQLYINSGADGAFVRVLETDAPIRTVFQTANGDILVSAGDQTGSVTKSSNLGQTWVPTTMPFVQKFYESKTGLLFGAGSSRDHVVSSNSFISSTNGTSWSEINIGSPIFDIIVNASNDIFVASDGLFISKNSGAAYNLIGPANAKIHTVLNPAPDQLFCVSGITTKYARYWTSQNDGGTWSEIDKGVFNKPLAFLDAKIVGQDRIWMLLGYSANNDTTVATSVLYETRNAGRTWRQVREFSKPAGFDVDKTRNTVYLWITGEKYFYRTDDFGSAWIPTSLPFEVGKLFAASEDLLFGYSVSDIGRIRHLYYSFNKGDKWLYSSDVPYNSDGIARLAVDRFGHVYKITAIKESEKSFKLSSIIRSANYGETFVNVTPDSGSVLNPAENMFCISTDHNGALFLAGSHFVSVSRNNGNSWKEIFNSETQEADILCIHSNNSVELYAGTSSNSIFKTSNKPVTFTPQLIDGPETTIASSFGVNWVDYDSDGFDDIFLVNDGPNMLYKNNKDGTFRRITSGSIVTDDEPSRSASWADYNNDGHIDCFISNGVKDVYNSLYRNNGDGTFFKITDGNIVEDYGDYRNSAWADFDNDGDLDLYVTEVSEEYPNILYINDGRNFAKSKDTVIGSKADRTYNCGWCDFDNDGDVDIYLANAGADNLFEQVRPGEFALVGSNRIDANMGSAVSCSWGDYDNDGWMDLFVVNYDRPNVLYHNDGDGSFTPVTAPGISTDNKISKGSGWADYDNDGDIDLFVVNRDSYLFYTNDGAGNFTKDEMSEFIYHGGNALAVAWGDKQNNGALDLVIASYDQQSLIYDNILKQNNWFKIRCAGNKTSNRSALGAKIKIVTTVNNQTRSQIRHISAASGHAAQNSLVQHFGLGPATMVDSIIIHWPSGKKQILLNKAANQRITVLESGTDFVEMANDNSSPKHYRLAQNYPNPFNPTTTIEYEIPENTFVTVNIFDANGQHVKTLVHEEKPAGFHSITWDGKNKHGTTAASGLYVYKMSTENFKSVGKMTLLR